MIKFDQNKIEHDPFFIMLQQDVVLHYEDHIVNKHDALGYSSMECLSPANSRGSDGACCKYMAPYGN